MFVHLDLKHIKRMLPTAAEPTVSKFAKSFGAMSVRPMLLLVAIFSYTIGAVAVLTGSSAGGIQLTVIKLS